MSYVRCDGTGKEVRRGPDVPVSRRAVCPVCGKDVGLSMFGLSMFGYIRAHKDGRKLDKKGREKLAMAAVTRSELVIGFSCLALWIGGAVIVTMCVVFPPLGLWRWLRSRARRRRARKTYRQDMSAVNGVKCAICGGFATKLFHFPLEGVSICENPVLCKAAMHAERLLDQEG